MDNPALINICSIGHESSAMGAEFFESHSTLERADLAVGTPTSPSVAAALRLGDGIPVARADLAHVLEHLREAVPFPVVEALVLGGAGCEAVIALAGVAPPGVEAAPVLTDAWLGLTFILIYAGFPIRCALIPGSTDAYIRANEVLAFHLLFSTVMLQLFTLIQVFAHPPVFSQDIASWTFAFIRPVSVYTSESTEQRILGTLVYIFTSHHWTRLKSLLTGAFKPSNHILASSISTRIAHRTFINIYTFIPLQNVTKGTLAAVGAVRVDALPVFTDIRFFALIHINC